MNEMVFDAKKNLLSVYYELFGEKTDHPLIARLLAFLIDYIMFHASVTLISYALYREGEDPTTQLFFSELGGLVIYLSVGNSYLTKGQTLGKKLLKIRTVDIEGNYLGLGRAFLRSLPIALLIDSTAIMLFAFLSRELVANTVIIVLTILYTGSLYFPLFKLNRQGLHDILMSTQVIPKNRIVTTEEKTSMRLFFVFVITTTVLLIYLFLSR